jgi:hypothetical protein
MSEKTKTPDHLIRKLEDARRRIAELEAGETERKKVEEEIKWAWLCFWLPNLLHR